MSPTELRQRAAELEVEVRADILGREDERGAAAYLAALAEWDVALLRRATLGKTWSGGQGADLLLEAVEIAESEANV